MVQTGDPSVSAKEKMNAAESALVAYVESKQSDPELLKRLIENVNQAITEYLKAVAQTSSIPG